MMTRRGRIIKMPARFLLITIIGILFQTGSSTNDTSNITMVNGNITECFDMEEMLYGLLIFSTPFMFMIIMMILFLIINGFISFFTKYFEQNPTYEMIQDNEWLLQSPSKEQPTASTTDIETQENSEQSS